MTHFKVGKNLSEIHAVLRLESPGSIITVSGLLRRVIEAELLLYSFLPSKTDHKRYWLVVPSDKLYELAHSGTDLMFRFTPGGKLISALHFYGKNLSVDGIEVEIAKDDGYLQLNNLFLSDSGTDYFLNKKIVEVIEVGHQNESSAVNDPLFRIEREAGSVHINGIAYDFLSLQIDCLEVLWNRHLDVMSGAVKTPGMRAKEILKAVNALQNVTRLSQVFRSREKAFNEVVFQETESKRFRLRLELL